MKKIIAILMLLFVLIGLCACSGSKTDVIGIWKINLSIDERYLYVYDDGYTEEITCIGKSYSQGGSNNWEYLQGSSYDWEYDGKIFIQKDYLTGEIHNKYIVKDGKMYSHNRSLYATRVDTDTSNEKPHYNEEFDK